jgi:hypothetical protein
MRVSFSLEVRETSDGRGCGVFTQATEAERATFLRKYASDNIILAFQDINKDVELP